MRFCECNDDSAGTWCHFLRSELDGVNGTPALSMQEHGLVVEVMELPAEVALPLSSSLLTRPDHEFGATHMFADKLVEVGGAYITYLGALTVRFYNDAKASKHQSTHQSTPKHQCKAHQTYIAKIISTNASSVYMRKLTRRLVPNVPHAGKSRAPRRHRESPR